MYLHAAEYETKILLNNSCCLMIIREIQPKDAGTMADIVRNVILEVKIPTTGTAYQDKALEDLYTAYNGERKVYFVIEDQDVVVGGAGIAPIEGADKNTCELQKMYFLPQIRGKGFGLKLIQDCLKAAKSMGYTHCYIETMDTMKAAQNLYKKVGFTTIDSPIGNTGHCSCEVWMLKALN